MQNLKHILNRLTFNFYLIFTLYWRRMKNYIYFYLLFKNILLCNLGIILLKKLGNSIIKWKYETVVPFARYHYIITVAWQVKGHWSIASGRRGPVSSQQTLPRDLRQAIAFESQTIPVPLCSTILYLFLSLYVRRNSLGYDSFDLNSNANLGHLSIFYRFPVVRPTIRNYDISKTFLYLFFLFKRNQSLVHNYYTSSYIKRNSENIESLINKGTSMIHADFNEILHDFSSI